MDMVSTEASAERDFHHPYSPYEIQLQFMDALYSTLEDGKIGIFESPTGKFAFVSIEEVSSRSYFPYDAISRASSDGSIVGTVSERSHLFSDLGYSFKLCSLRQSTKKMYASCSFNLRIAIRHPVKIALPARTAI